MSNGILLVQARPSSPEDVETFHKWYDEVHVPEILRVDGFVSARRFAPLDGDTFVAVYEIEGDLEAAQANLRAAHVSGRMSPPQGVLLDPPPVTSYLSQL
jgi:hypothetical protein